MLPCRYSASQTMTTTTPPQRGRDGVPSILPPALADTLIRIFLLLPVRLFLELCCLIYTYLFVPCPFAVGVDEKPISSGVRRQHNIPYGPGKRENMDLVCPSMDLGYRPGFIQALASTFRNPPLGHLLVHAQRVALFVHGGGWMIPGTKVQYQQLTPWARQDRVATFSMNYPLVGGDGPLSSLACCFRGARGHSNAFPVPVVSVLRALACIRSTYGVCEISLVGESAGAGLVTCVAALLTHRPLLARFAAHVAACGDAEAAFDIAERWRFPRVASVVSWYGILDRVAWRPEDRARESRGGLSFVEKLCRGGLAWCIEQYLPDAQAATTMTTTWPAHCGTLCDLLVIHNEANSNGEDDGDDEDDDSGNDSEVLIPPAEMLQNYPPTLFITGTRDPTGLEHSSIKACRALRRVTRHPVRIQAYEGTHGFVAYPPQIQAFLGARWRQAALPATMATIDWICGRFADVPDVSSCK